MTGGGMEIEGVGELAAIVRLGMGEPAEREAATADGRALFARSVKVVAGTRNRRSHYSTVAI